MSYPNQYQNQQYYPPPYPEQQYYPAQQPYYPGPAQPNYPPGQQYFTDINRYPQPAQPVIVQQPVAGNYRQRSGCSEFCCGMLCCCEACKFILFYVKLKLKIINSIHFFFRLIN